VPASLVLALVVVSLQVPALFPVLLV